MANFVVYELLVADSSGEGQHLVVSNQGGELVTSVYSSPNATTQPEKITSVQSVSKSDFYPTKAKTTVGDSFIQATMVKEIGVYLVDYTFLGEVSVFGGDDAVEADAEFTLVKKRYVSFRVQRVINVTSLSSFTAVAFADDSSDKEVVVGGTSTGFTNTLIDNSVVFSCADDVSAFTSAKYTMTGESIVKLTKLA